MKEILGQLANIDLSQLHFYSYGKVVDDNPDNEFVIKVFPVEKQYLADASLLEEKPLEPVDLKIKHKEVKVVPEELDARCILKEETIEVTPTNFIYAEWFNFSNSNRITPPNVCKGEDVILLRFSNSNLFYWDTIRSRNKYRKLEHVVDRYSNKEVITETDGIVEETDIETDYYKITSTRDKLIKLHTSDNNGELTTYDISIDTANGKVTLIDGKNNSITLDSANDHLDVSINDLITINTNKVKTNANDNTIDLLGDENNLNIDIKNDINGKVANDVKFDINNNLLVKINKVSIGNGENELLAIITELIEAITEEQHVGNLGIPTNLTDDSISKFNDIKDKLATIKV